MSPSNRKRPTEGLLKSPKKKAVKLGKKVNETPPVNSENLPSETESESEPLAHANEQPNKKGNEKRKDRPTLSSQDSSQTKKTNKSKTSKESIPTLPRSSKRTRNIANLVSDPETEDERDTQKRKKKKNRDNYDDDYEARKRHIPKPGASLASRIHGEEQDVCETFV